MDDGPGTGDLPDPTSEKGGGFHEGLSYYDPGLDLANDPLSSGSVWSWPDTVGGEPDLDPPDIDTWLGGPVCRPLGSVDDAPYVNVVSDGSVTCYTPPRGIATDDLGNTAESAPGATRLMLALSTDGVTWTRTNLVIADQAALPTVITVEGTVYLFFGQATIDGESYGKVAMAYSSDLVNWTFKRVILMGSPFATSPNPFPDIDWDTETSFDPTVVAVEDQPGMYRLYFTLKDGPHNPQSGQPPTNFATFSAWTTDLENGVWTYDAGIRFPTKILGDLLYSSDGYIKVQDPVVQWVGDHYEYFAGGSPTGYIYGGESVDGLDISNPTLGNMGLIPGNGAEVRGAYKIYGIDQSTSNGFILSMTWLDGLGWWMDSAGPMLEVDETAGLESTNVMGPAVAPRPNPSYYPDSAEPACYLMVYQTMIPAPE